MVILEKERATRHPSIDAVEIREEGSTPAGGRSFIGRGGHWVSTKEKGRQIGASASSLTGQIRTDGCVPDHEGSLCALNVLFGGRYHRGGR